jgi:diadenosine tetraphosphate (Ap4A) HIT family hydrolase
VSFVLHPTLAGDTLPVASLEASELRLMNDARFPWCILVPRLPEVTEWHHLPGDTQALVTSEINRVGGWLETLPGVTKINIGALGNRVTQLHIHVLGRHPGDAAWPDPVWGHGNPEPYSPEAADRLIEQLRQSLSSRD